MNEKDPIAVFIADMSTLFIDAVSQRREKANLELHDLATNPNEEAGQIDLMGRAQQLVDEQRNMSWEITAIKSDMDTFTRDLRQRLEDLGILQSQNTPESIDSEQSETSEATPDQEPQVMWPGGEL